ncbi:uncharacterized protein LOC135837584 [Planococcus citri]|uniref:uncharacterized protein LOC135837584 n=1 Tax=Planococcus citri TaxID=170843 RepID=UPI0031F7FBA0
MANNRKFIFYISFHCAFMALFLILRIRNADSQKVRFATRFRNFSVASETDSMYLINMTIFQHGMEHRLAVYMNFTKNIVSKNIHVIVQRCTYERFSCEYFQTWKFNENIKAILYMKNQIWTPIFQNLTPRLTFPVVQKGIYRANNATLNTDALMLFYSEAAKYYFKAEGILYDKDEKKAGIVFFEVGVFEYVERNRKQDKG